MARTINGRSYPTTPAEKRAAAATIARRAISAFRGKRVLSNKHDMLMLGTALNRMRDAEKRLFFAQNLGTWNRTVWRQFEQACRVGATRSFAQNVTTRTKLIRQQRATLSGASAGARDAQTWVLSKINQI